MGFFSRKASVKVADAKSGAIKDAIPSLAPSKSAVNAAAPLAAATAAPGVTAVAPVAPQSQATSPASRPILPTEELEKIKARSKQVSAAFGQIVSLLMRDPKYQNYTLADLE